MMRGWTPLFVVLAALLLPRAARAQEPDGEEQMPPCCTPPPPIPPRPLPPAISPQPVPPPLVVPPPAIVCCAEPPVMPTRKLFLALSVGPSYRRAFNDDFIAAMPEIELGGQTRNLSIAARFSAALGATRIGLPFQFFNVGPTLMFHVAPSIRFGFALSFGFMMYERATVWPDPVVWSPALGAALDLTVDLARLRSGGVLFVAARLGSDWIFPLRNSFTEGLSVSPSVAFGWRL
jgi:hypothetical protein